MQLPAAGCTRRRPEELRQRPTRSTRPALFARPEPYRISLHLWHLRHVDAVLEECHDRNPGNVRSAGRRATSRRSPAVAAPSLLVACFPADGTRAAVPGPALELPSRTRQATPLAQEQALDTRGHGPLRRRRADPGRLDGAGRDRRLQPQSAAPGRPGTDV